MARVTRAKGLKGNGIKGDYLVAVESDPRADVNATISKMKWVMKGGLVLEKKQFQGGGGPEAYSRRSHSSYAFASD